MNFWPIKKNYAEILIRTAINVCIINNIGNIVSSISDLVLRPSINCYHLLHLVLIIVFLDLFW